MFFHGFTRRSAQVFLSGDFPRRKVRASLPLVILLVVGALNALSPSSALAENEGVPAPKVMRIADGKTTEIVTVNADGSVTTTTKNVTTVANSSVLSVGNPRVGTTTSVNSDGVLTVTTVTLNGDGIITTIGAATKGAGKSASKAAIPKLAITRFDLPEEVTVGEPTFVELLAEIRGITPDGDVQWEWDEPVAKFSEDAPKTDEEWKKVAPSANCEVSLRTIGSGRAIQIWTINEEGYYQMRNKVTAIFEVNGQKMVLQSGESSDDVE